MDPTNNPADESDPVAPPPSPSPTARDIATTEAQAQAPLTHSFHPTADAFEDGFQLAEPAVPLNTSVDGYLLLENIGRGGMGVVVKAKQPGSGQIVALKMIRDGVFADQESLDRFRQEIATLGRVQPLKNVVPIYHVGDYQGHLYYVMPYLPRGNVALHLKHYNENPREAVTVVQKIARAVHQLHLHQILHRDVKPGNILLNAEGEPYLSDFGLIKQLDRDQSLTTTNQRLGTPAYMAPEQTGLLAEPIDRATDVWALGVVLYEMLTGVRPFTAPKGEETTTLLWRIAYEEPRGPRALAPNLDRGLEAVILKCLEKHPRNRYASADELADELGRWLDNQPLKTRPPGAMTLWWRRHPLGRRTAVAFLLVVPVLVAAVPVYRHFADPERPLRDIQHEFATLGRVELMRDNMPRWSEWAFGDADKPKRSDDGFLQLTSENLQMLVLVKDLPGPGVRLTAQIRHDLADSQLAEAGLFVAHTPPNSDPTAPRVFYRCSFNDVQPDQDIIDTAKLKVKLPKGNQFFIGYVFYAERKDGEPFYDAPLWPGPKRFEPVGFNKRTWREVSLEFHVDKLTAKFDGKLSRSLPISAARKKLTKTIADDMKYFPDAPPVAAEFNTKGAIGLMITRGSASFKDVVVERIK